jgi:hypothetical protein
MMTELNELTLSNLPSIANARLPATYETAVAAIVKASKVDECHDWANKAEAMASYARQSRDDVLYKMAIRIQSRATKRCGELLAQVPAAKGARTDIEPRTVGDTKLTRASAATSAGMSKRQKDTALRVAAVPHADFERQVESDDPPTVTKLAEQGKKARPLVDLEGIDPDDYKSATGLQGEIRSLASYCRTHDPARVAGAFKSHERQALRDNIAFAGEWLRAFADHLPG